MEEQLALAEPCAAFLWRPVSHAVVRQTEHVRHNHCKEGVFLTFPPDGDRICRLKSTTGLEGKGVARNCRIALSMKSIPV